MGNTVGSLSGEQREIIVGSLLGDGSMRCRANALLEINHSIHQRSYVDWKYESLRGLVSTPPKSRPGNGQRVAYRFVTRSLPELTPYHRAFYGTGRKLIPDRLELGPLTLAVWFMDDGSKSRRALYLNTQQFGRSDQHHLLRLLKQQWGIDGSLNRDKEYFRIRISVGSTPTLIQAIRPHLLEEFSYKLPQVTP